MSENNKSKIIVGDTIDGEVLGAVNNRNTVRVEQDENYDYDVGNKIKGAIARTATISNENFYDIKSANYGQQQPGTSVGQHATKSYRLKGNRTFINQDFTGNTVFTNIGGVTRADQIRGNINYKLNYVGNGQENDEQSVGADPNAKHISNVGGVVVVKKVDGAINHQSDVTILKN